MSEPSTALALAVGPASFQIHASSDAAICLNWLRDDFESFAAEEEVFCREELTLELGASSSAAARGPFRFSFAEGKFSGMGARRRVDYVDGARVEADRAKGRTRITARTLERLYEVAYLYLLSRVGEAYDLSGRHRVHGLGFRFPGEDRGWLLVMDSGVGKSRLALALRGKVEFFSDESPLLGSRGRLTAFPIRLAIAPSLLRRSGFDPEIRRKLTRLSYGTKCLVPLRELGVIAPPSRLAVVAKVTRSSNGRPQWRKAQRTETFVALLRCCVVGIGVAQMAEHFLRLDFVGLSRLVRIGWSRLVTARRAIHSARRLAIEFSEDPAANARMLEEIRVRLAKGL